MVTIVALIAAFNEEAHVGDVVRGAGASVDSVVVVDDGSTDGTAACAERAGATVLRLERNGGKGRAVRAGLDYVLRQSMSHVLLLDADLQHDPAEIPKLIACATQGRGDFVIGERAFRKQGMPRARYLSNVIGSAILSRLTAAHVRDSQSGFRLIRADFLRRVTFTATRYEIETEMLIKIVRAGAIVEHVTLDRLTYDGAHSKMRPVRDTFRTCMLALKYRFLS